MSLLQNITLNAQYPCRFNGGISSNELSTLGNKTEKSKNIFVGEAGFSQKSGIPIGYNAPYSWRIALKPGGLGVTSQEILGSGITSNANAAKGINIVPTTITASGTITSASLQLIVSAVATIISSGGFSTDPVVQGILQATSTLHGSGTITTAQLGAIVDAVVTILSSGTVTTADLRAIAQASAEITPFTELSPENLAKAVMKYNVEGTYTFEQVIRIMSAVQAGKTTITNLGGGSATVDFRNLADTINRVTADMTGSERTDMTYLPEE